MASSMYQVRFDSFTAAPGPAATMVVLAGLTTMSPLILRGHKFSLELKGPADVAGPWVTEVRSLVTGSPVGTLVGLGAVLEYDKHSLVALWDLGMGQRLLVPSSPKAPIEIPAEVGEAALTFINRHRARCAQRPLDPVAAGWTADDLVIEAQRLGWDGKR